MVNSLRHYHLGCGERLQSLQPLTIESEKLAGKHCEQSNAKATLKKKTPKGQH